jgi:hypothetical protein
LGDSLINFWTVFNFNVGDVFFYQDNGGDFAGPDFGSGYWKYTITGKTVLSDSIQYKIMEDRYSEYYSSFYNTTTYSQIRDTAVLTFCDSINHLANTYPGQYLNAVSQMYYPMINYLASCSNCGETYAAYFSHPYFPVLCKAEPASYSNANGNVLVPNGYDDNGMQDNGAQGNCMICAGLGPVTYNWSVFEGGQSEELVGYTKNGISYGTILAIPDINNNVSHLQVYPTIVRENINVFISEPVNPNKLNFTLYDLTGRQLLNQELNANRTSINCGKLASALYVWRVTYAQQNIVGSGKLVKQ